MRKVLRKFVLAILIMPISGCWWVDDWGEKRCTDVYWARYQDGVDVVDVVGDEYAGEIIATINSGLAIMRQSGEWYDIVSAGLLEQARKVAPKS